MNYVDIIGFVAGALTTFAYVPQVVKTLRIKSAKDLSLAWIVVAVVGIALWTVYGLIVVSYPVIVANAVSIMLALCLLYLKLRWG